MPPAFKSAAFVAVAIVLVAAASFSLGYGIRGRGPTASSPTASSRPPQAESFLESFYAQLDYEAAVEAENVLVRADDLLGWASSGFDDPDALVQLAGICDSIPHVSRFRARPFDDFGQLLSATEAVCNAVRDEAVQNTPYDWTLLIKQRVFRPRDHLHAKGRVLVGAHAFNLRSWAGRVVIDGEKSISYAVRFCERIPAGGYDAVSPPLDEASARIGRAIVDLCRDPNAGGSINQIAVRIGSELRGESGH